MAGSDPSAQETDRTPFPIVGVGASAGGLEALKEFFGNMPADTGVGFVVVTHTHPEHTSMLPDILTRTTSLPVVEASDGQRVDPDSVYIAPPGDNLTIEGGVLRQGGGTDHRTNLPIDHFLRSLASDQREHAICIILSGSGSDGTLGLQAVKGEAGMAMVQTPQSARFGGMPLSAEGTGLADYVLDPTDMPSELAAYARELMKRTRVAPAKAPAFPPDALRRILGALRTHTGHEFSSYKASTVQRRIERRMNVHRIESPDEYAQYVREHPHEAGILFRELLIVVTRFFRDAEAFDALAECVPDLVQDCRDGDRLRVWVPGCATGEEAYSVAIVVHEAMTRVDRGADVQIFATDLDPRAIDTARAGIYPAGIAADVSEGRLRRYFKEEDGAYRVAKHIREMVIFAPQNVLSDPPFTRLDLIVCRNVMIYFETDAQRSLLPAFHYALRPGGILFLGPSESIGPLGDHFIPVDRRWKIYRRKDSESHLPADLLELPSRPMRRDTGPAEAPAKAPQAGRADTQIMRMLVSHFAPTCVVVEESGDIVHIHGRTGLFLEPSEGRPSHNVIEMAREGLSGPLAASLRRAAADQRPVHRNHVAVKTNGEETAVDIGVIPVESPSALRGLYLVTLRRATETDSKRARRKKPAGARADDPGRVAELEAELGHTRETLQSTVEELESSNEELKSANEELQSMNEELQSTNEELETSKEEMQSLNEELTTVNAELNSKLEQLSQANDDMQNLLNGIDVATVFVDQNLRVKRYTEKARQLIHLVPADIGRPLEDLAFHVEHPDLMEDCRHVLDTLERREYQVQAPDGAYLVLRIIPYRTSENVIDGVVLSFIPIDQIKRAEMRYFEKIVETVREPLLVLEGDLTVRSANEAFYRIFQVEARDVEGRSLYDLGGGQWDIDALRELLETILPSNEQFNDFEVEHDFPGIGRRRFLLNARRMRGDGTRPDLILLAMEDATEDGHDR